MTSRKISSAIMTSMIGVLAWGSFSATAMADDAERQAAQKLLPAQYRDAGVLKVAASVVYPPHSYLKEGTTEWTGYEIDLFNAIAAVLDVKVEYVQAPFQQLVAGVASGRSDVALGDLGDNDLRQEKVDFIDHSQITFQLSVPAGNPEHIKTVFDLCGRELGTVQGTTDVVKKALEKCESKGFPAPKFIAFPDETSRYQAQQSGRIPQTSDQQTDTARYFKKNGIFKELDYVAAPEFGNLYIGYIVNKGNAGLSNALLAGLEVLIRDGTYAKILAKWDASDNALKNAGINIGSEATNWKQPRV
ncbi:transporter substrate-binding domain-containing protein [Mesorhizobium sp. 113-3-3]|uniref:transporter substrate-binding domain-containing protein n=1 Tax=Mesorhizobium sp. 113-3-3 TaxID=2744516 RepID=UPI0019263033|nr:transporter substrate-binding domain-containing protein [Mesorhizobium sp. 113-3-3]BCG82207.1 ABC transporter substrate-binding protein [Mesorhizobium sp. 113-3-3]